MRQDLGFARGFLAVVINIVVVVGLSVLIGLVSGGTHSSSGSASVHLSGVGGLAWFVLALAYLVVPKVRTGQTIGRMLVGGRVSR